MTFSCSGAEFGRGIFRAAVNPSMEAAGKTSLFFTPRKIPFQTRLLVTGIVLQE
jgi:hypothetical protein